MCEPDISVIERFMNDFEIPPGQTNLTYRQIIVTELNVTNNNKITRCINWPIIIKHMPVFV